MMDITLEQFIEKNKGLIYQLAKKYYRMTCIYGIELDDLYQVGCLGLIEKYKEYDSSKGKMSTFAYQIVRGSILNYLNDNNCSITHIPRNLCLLSQKLAKENVKFYKRNGRYMTEVELVILLKDLPAAKKCPNKKELIRWINQIILYHYRDSVYALNDPIINYDVSGNFYELKEQNPTIEDLLVADFDMEQEVIMKVDLEIFLNSLDYLSPQEKEAFIETLGLRDDIPKTRRFLAEKENVWPQTIDQRYHKALRKVKGHQENRLI